MLSCARTSLQTVLFSHPACSTQTQSVQKLLCTGNLPEASPPFRTASGNYPDPDLPSPTPTPPPAFSPSPIHQTPAPQSSLFEPAASPATIPAKRFGSDAGTAAASTSTLDTGIPAMFSSGTGREAAFPSTEAAGKPNSLLANKGDGAGKSGSDYDVEGKESAKPTAAASGWGSSFLKVPLLTLLPGCAILWHLLHAALSCLALTLRVGPHMQLSMSL
jgi:hypothetical protein